VAVPRDREHHAAIRGVRHHDRRVGRQKGVVEDEMECPGSARSASASGSASRRTESENAPVALTTRAPRSSTASGLLIGRDDAVDEAVGPLGERDDARVVEQRRALIGRGRDEIDQQPRSRRTGRRKYTTPPRSPSVLIVGSRCQRLLAREDLGRCRTRTCRRARCRS
jgi:hypothetical protein